MHICGVIFQLRSQKLNNPCYAAPREHVACLGMYSPWACCSPIACFFPGLAAPPRHAAPPGHDAAPLGNLLSCLCCFPLACCSPRLASPPRHATPPKHAAPPDMMMPPGYSALLRMLFFHGHSAKAKKYKFYCSTSGSLFRHICIFTNGGFSLCGSQFRHFFSNFFLKKAIYVFIK
jgi:hypothetical protein